MSNRFLKGNYKDSNEAVRDVTAVVNSVVRDDAQPERWNVLIPDVMPLNASPPTFSVFKNGVGAFSFVSDSVNQLYMTAELPSTWKQGTPIVPVLSWANASGGAGSVVWRLEYIWQNEGKAYSQSTSIISAMVSATTTSHHYLNAQFTSITASGSIGAIILCRLYRDGGDASDNFGANAFLLNFKFLIQHDTNRGSQFQYQKFDGR
jgi:hypothetical protein